MNAKRCSAIALASWTTLLLAGTTSAQTPAVPSPVARPLAPAAEPVTAPPPLTPGATDVGPRAPVVFAMPGVPAAQDLAPEERCKQAYPPDGAAPKQEFCKALAVVGYTMLMTGVPVASPPPRPSTSADIEPEAPDTAGAQGSTGQASAAPRGTPVVFAGGTLAIAGTNVGTQAITSVALNPLALFGDVDDTEAMASYTRFADVAVVLPFDLKEGASSNDAIGFVGFRARINFLAWSNGAAALAKLKEVNEAYKTALAGGTELMIEIEKSLRAVADPGACIAALGTRANDRIAAACNGLQPDLVRLQAAEKVLADRRAAVLTTADADYLGLDLRADFGDQNLSLEGEQDGTSLLGAVAFGRRLAVSKRYGVWFRGRAGANYQDLESRDKPLFEGDGQLGFALAAVPGTPGFDFETALEGRYGNSDDLDVDTDFLQLRLSSSVPISNAARLTFGVMIPLAAADDRGREPVITSAIDWGLTLPDGS